jgi:Transposase IS66 family
MGPALLLIAQLYRVEKQARLLTVEDRLRLRQIHARPILDKLHRYLLEIQTEVLPKSPEGRAVRYALKNWTALNRYSKRRRSGNRQYRHGAQHSRCGKGEFIVHVIFKCLKT